MRFVIIDSGFECCQGENKFGISGITVDVKDGETVLREGFEDRVGHGTAITDVFTSNLKGDDDYEVFVVKVFMDNDVTTAEHLCSALEYINDAIDCELILISSGIRISESYSRMKSAVDKLVNKNVVVVSAFDNSGAMSYPAAFENVIGVDVSVLENCKKRGQFIVCENSPINIVCGEFSYRVKWINNRMNIIKGSSFDAAFIASIIAGEIRECGGRISYEHCLGILKKKAVDVVEYKETDEISGCGKRFMSGVSKAIVFPFNKEIHSLAKFESMLCVDIVDFYDVRQSGLVGMKICEAKKYINNERVIKDYNLINWEGDFDTVILGHTKKLGDLLNKNLAQWFVENCRKYQKKLYSFDDIEVLAEGKLNREACFVPKTEKSYIVSRNRGKQYVNGKPIVGVLGTSSQQGKYTLQLMLRNLFQKEGYKVAQIGTEPTGYLFGFDYVYPMGYNSAVYVDGYEAVSRLNLEMHKCEECNPDVIIVGGQSQSAPRINYNVNHYNLAQTEFLLGTQPDLVVLCINFHDDMDYIERTIKYIEGICRCKVIGCCLFPQKLVMENGVLRKSSQITEEEYMAYREEFFYRRGISVYRLERKEDIAELYDLIIERLS